MHPAALTPSARQPAGQPARGFHEPPESLSEMQTKFPTGTCCVRPLLRQSPAAAAEWAKPREIRRGTRSSVAYYRAPLGVLDKFSILLLRYSYRRNARDPSHRTPSVRSFRISKHVSKTSVFRPDHAYSSRLESGYVGVTVDLAILQ